MSEQDLRLTVTAEDRATPVLKNVNREAQLLESHQKRFRDVIKQIGADDPAWVRRLAEGKGLAEKISPILGGRPVAEIREWAKEWLRAREALKDTEEATEDSGETAKESATQWGGLGHMMRLLRYRASSLVVGLVWAGVAMKTAIDFKRYGLDIAVATQKTQEFARATSTLRDVWRSGMQWLAGPVIDVAGKALAVPAEAIASQVSAAEALKQLNKQMDEAGEKHPRFSRLWVEAVRGGRSAEEMARARYPEYEDYIRRARMLMAGIREEGLAEVKPDEKIALYKQLLSLEQRRYAVHEEGLPLVVKAAREYLSLLKEQAILARKAGPGGELREAQLGTEILGIRELQKELAILTAGGEEYGKLMPRAQYWATMLQGQLRTPENLRAQKESLSVQERMRDLAQQVADAQIMGSREQYEWLTKAEQHQQSMYRVQRAFFIREAFGASAEAMGRAGIGAGRLLELSGVGPKGYRSPSSAMAPISPAVGKITVAFDDMSSEGKEKLLREMSAFMLRLGRSATFH